MKKSRFTEEQVIAILREQEAGETTADLCLKHCVSTATFYKWKATYGGIDIGLGFARNASSHQAHRIEGRPLSFV